MIEAGANRIGASQGINIVTKKQQMMKKLLNKAKIFLI